MWMNPVFGQRASGIGSSLKNSSTPPPSGVP
jgi:hypothetical protein